MTFSFSLSLYICIYICIQNLGSAQYVNQTPAAPGLVAVERMRCRDVSTFPMLIVSIFPPEPAFCAVGVVASFGISSVSEYGSSLVPGYVVWKGSGSSAHGSIMDAISARVLDNDSIVIKPE